ncbi:DUF7310 family coiled-coil domain-containing protein [Haladaptatus sp. CMSO5]|uniref:DUF7310 family coiled-coil domain-containing protein n=1 Tax=Haladaptatus sp. CMSO5 TaxID=3120514 RepID=UPI002FCE08BB
MTEIDALEERLSAVERTLTDTDQPVSDLEHVAALTQRIDAVTDRLDTIDERLDRLDAAVQAVRGYVGQQKAVNDDVEQRADAALAAVDRLERTLDSTQPEPEPRQSLDSFEPAEDTGEEATGLLERFRAR